MTDVGKEPGAATHRVFISYASENIDSTTHDRQVADQIYSTLESQGIRCWIAHRNILPGDEWLNAIIDAVEKSKIVVLVFSANTEQSQWVKDEITMALKQKIKIIPFRIENVSPQQSLRILDVHCQWMDAYTPPLEKHIESLVKIVSRHLGLEPAIPIKKETLKEQPVPNQVKPAAKERKAVKEKTMPAKDKEKPPEVVKEAIRKQEKKPKKPLLQKRILIAISIIILLTAAVLIIRQIVKHGDTADDKFQKQKATMREMKFLGMAIESYIIDNDKAPEAKTFAELNPILTPFYIKVLPLKDAWGNDFHYYHGPGNKKDEYTIGSGGEDGVFNGWEQRGFYLVKTVKDFDNDIILSNGQFVYGPKVK